MRLPHPRPAAPIRWIAIATPCFLSKDVLCRILGRHKLLLPPELGWEVCHARRARDPFNSALNYDYCLVKLDFVLLQTDTDV